MKYLTDAQTSFLFVEMLRRLGWDVSTVYDHKIENEPADYRVLAYARTMDRSLITFDHHRGQAGVDVATELKERGGKLICIGGGPDQLAERALGRLLFHYPEWYPLLERYDGKVEISDTKRNCMFHPRGEAKIQLQSVDDPDFEPYLARKKQARKRPLARKLAKKTPREQSAMMLYERPRKRTR